MIQTGLCHQVSYKERPPFLDMLRVIIKIIHMPVCAYLLSMLDLLDTAANMILYKIVEGDQTTTVHLHKMINI